jgi:DNA invertase Pin-like site-specific DNA recombinase
MLIGYARVSSTGQSLEVQREKLKGCTKIYEETRSGRDDRRPQLAACLAYIREGDTLVVTKLDRLARSTLHLCQIADDLAKRGIALRVLDQNIDTSDATGRLLFHMLSAIAQFETELRAERQKDGIESARERGVHLGRHRVLTADQVAALRTQRQAGMTITQLVAEYGVGRATIYRALAGVDAQEGAPHVRS